MNCEANLGFLPVAVIFSTMQELNVFSSSNPVLLSLASVLFQNSRKQFGPKTGYFKCEKSFSRNVIFNNFQTEKKITRLENHVGLLCTNINWPPTGAHNPQTTFIVLKMHKEKQGGGRPTRLLPHAKMLLIPMKLFFSAG